MDGGAWKAAVHGVTEGQTRLSDFTFTFYFHALEKEMATHSSVLAWRIPGTGEPGGPPSMGSHRVGHDWSDLAASQGFDQLCFMDCPRGFCTNNNFTLARNVLLIGGGKESRLIPLNSSWECLTVFSFLTVNSAFTDMFGSSKNA